ncbi:hypothetical protein CANMA_005390 [Candida margitis]|uniref:uncharacterized protein n=1 Tax=Candida margitis TaxID=1775924 RepID=UPI002227A7D8|nr:uncharacterized protein CANMA_005390 [Candida margitis]KAI5950036.1 hypothetical protein CANMA_005390 [Candida margitis]
MSPGDLVQESANTGDGELMDSNVTQENNVDLELRSVSGTESPIQSPRYHDTSSPFIDHPQSPNGKPNNTVNNRDSNIRNACEVVSPQQHMSKGGSRLGNEIEKHSPVKHDSFVDNSLDGSHLTQTPIKLKNHNVSPWRQFRPPSNVSALTSSASILNNKPDLKYSSTNHRSADSETNTHSENEELNNQLIHYKIKLKLMRDFLRDLIDKKSIDTSEIQSIIADVDIKPSQSSLEKQIVQLQADKKESLEIMEELQANLEDFERCIKDQQIELTELKDVLEKCKDSVGEFVMYVQKEEDLKAWRKDTFQQSPFKPLEEQVGDLIQFTKDMIKISINNEVKLDNGTTPLTPPASNYDMDNTVDLVKEIEELRREKRELAEKNTTIAKELSNKIQEVQGLHEKLEATTELNVQLEQSLELERNESAEKVSHLQTVIEELKNDLKSTNDRGASHDIEEVPLSIHYESLVAEHQDLQSAYASLLNELSQLREAPAAHEQPVGMEKVEQHSSNSETTYLSDQANKVSELQAELNQALKQQQMSNSEQARMSYINANLKRENEELQSKLKQMAEFVTFATTDEKERVMKKLSVMEFQFKDLLKFDLGEFQRLIQSFNKIAEDESLLNPIKKYEKIKKALAGDVDESSTRIVRENHKSVFDYFVRATDILINNYVRLLLAEDESHANETWKKQVTKLKEQNSLLKNELELLQKKIQGSATAESPTSKLRLNDIRQKWKAERERRIMEEKEANKRYNDLKNDILKTMPA